ncbi:DUF4855 domain-containing protein [Paenibacillus sp. GCM10027626]|uniref:DUF4855 domain-containing protein n=1 Tax=Paenibacillus sp. GCM10027626 TaxID=3273411 RepID=UPI00362B7AB4
MIVKRGLSLVISVILMLMIVPHTYAAASDPSTRNLAIGATYEWSMTPDSDHPDNGTKLTDGMKGNLDINDPQWVGQKGKITREIVFDLGASQSISSINAHFLQHWPDSSTLFPLTVSMYASNDKQNWGKLANKATEHFWVDGPPVDQNYTWEASKDGVPAIEGSVNMIYARYVKVTFTLHPRALSLLDEVEIWGADGKVQGAREVPADTVDYLHPGEATAGISNLSLFYNGYYRDHEKWTKEMIIPEISYVNKQGEPVDWFFDGVLTLGLSAPGGQGFNGGATKAEWSWYLDKTFNADGDMHQLNEATKEVGAKLGQPDHRLKVVIMIPDPGEYITNFGDVDGDGISENFNASEVGEETAAANRKKAVDWWIQQVLQRWEGQNYSHLELAGLYWLEEQISTSASGPDTVRAVNDLIHEQGLKSFWIPHSMAYKSYMWKDVGFDAVAYQLNYFFEDVSIEHIEDAAYTAQHYGTGVEIEFDGRILQDSAFRKRFMEYLQGGIQYGYMTNSFKAYYKGSGPVLAQAAASQDPEIRGLYDNLYNFTKGTFGATNAAPVAEDASFNTTVDQAVSGILPANDADGDTLVYSIVENGKKGKTVITNRASGAFTYRPNAGQTGTDTFKFKVNDGKADSNIATVTVQIASVQTDFQTKLTGTGAVQPGETFAVIYGLTGGAEGIYAQDVTLKYDPAVMEYISAKSRDKSVQIVETDKKTGKLRFVLASEGENHAMNGRENLIELTFKAKKVGKTTSASITVTNAILGNKQGQEFQAAPASMEIVVGKPGDFNGDGLVTVGDLAIVAFHYGKTSQSPDWEQVKRMDLNKDGKIDSADLQEIAKLMIK